MQITEAQSISEVLSHELARRTQRNASYSLRAFARDLSLSPSRLSEVMKGKNGLSETSLDSIVKKITKKTREQGYLRDIVLAEFARNEKVRELARARALNTRQIETVRKLHADEFAFISQWYHGAILELMQIPEFKSDAKWIGQRLGIKTGTVTTALERLEKLNFICKNSAGQWEAVAKPTTVFSSVPSLAVRKYHHQILALHIDSLREDPMEEREHLSTILAIPKARLPELKEELRKFQLEFWRKIADEPKDSLYSFSMQFCPIKNRRPGDSNDE